MIDFIFWQDSVMVGEDQFDWNEQFSSVAKQVLQWNSVKALRLALKDCFPQKPATFANEYLQVGLSWFC